MVRKLALDLAERGRPDLARKIRIAWEGVPDVQMDHGALWRQIRVATKMRLSIDIGSLLRLPDALQFDVRCPRRRRFTVRLNGADLYDIEVGRMDMDRLEYVPLATSLHVHVADLNRTLLRLAGLEG